MDPVGAVLSVGSLASILYAIIEGPSAGWTSNEVLGPGLVGLVLVMAFVSWERRVEHPMLPIDFFRDRGFALGLIAISKDGIVRCINHAALAILNIQSSTIINEHVNKLDEFIGTLLTEAVNGYCSSEPISWTIPKTGHNLNLLSKQLIYHGTIHGAFIIIKTQDEIREEPDVYHASPVSTKPKYLEFSPKLRHEIKNQLVAINTFVQLLPERYADPDFRDRFCEIINFEISKIQEIINLTPQEMEGGSFTISSLGGISGTYFTPIINPPEVAILGISKAKHEAIFIGNKLTKRFILPFSLSYDHRVIDGAEAAIFTKRFSELMANLNDIT